MYLLPLTLLTSLALLPLSYAASDNKNSDGSCDTANNQLQVGTLQLTTDCADSNFCNPNTGKCEPKGCRKDDFPLGYPIGSDLPKKCSAGSFCPDEGDACQQLIKVGSICQLNSDGRLGVLVSNAGC